jgi:hypothetical protein
LRRFVEWDTASSTRGLVSIPALVLVKLMESKSATEARKLGRWAGRELFIPSLKAQYGKLTVEQAIMSISMLASYGARFEFDHSVSGKMHVIMIRQPLGENWSHYFAGSLEGIFGDFFEIKIKLTVTSEVCLCEFAE